MEWKKTYCHWINFQLDFRNWKNYYLRLKNKKKIIQALVFGEQSEILFRKSISFAQLLSRVLEKDQIGHGQIMPLAWFMLLINGINYGLLALKFLMDGWLVSIYHHHHIIRYDITLRLPFIHSKISISLKVIQYMQSITHRMVTIIIIISVSILRNGWVDGRRRNSIETRTKTHCSAASHQSSFFSIIDTLLKLKNIYQQTTKRQSPKYL